MFDYYALPEDFPGFEAAEHIIDPYQKVAIIEEACYQDIGDRRFLPYIQLHEFEALLFVNPQMFEIEYFEHPDAINAIQSIAEEFGNPELINQGSDTAPSKRIIRVFPDYEFNKPAVGSMIAHEIGIDELRKTCIHFNEWVTKLLQLG
jgi:hypothetical protein